VTRVGNRRELNILSEIIPIPRRNVRGNVAAWRAVDSTILGNDPEPRMKIERVGWIGAFNIFVVVFHAVTIRIVIGRVGTKVGPVSELPTVGQSVAVRIVGGAVAAIDAHGEILGRGGSIGYEEEIHVIRQPG